MIWQRKKIGDLINLKRGYDLPSSNRIEGDVPIISSAGITDFHNEFKKNGEGVVTGRYGTLGEVFYINGKYWPLNTTLYITDFKGNHPKFIYYFLKTLQLERFNGAAAVPGLDRNVIHKVDVLFPKDINIQSKIASILSAYDELIENNQQRIKLLEEMAEEIYKEWFVRLRFPGYETVKFVDGLPEGWKKEKLDKLLETVKRKPKISTDQYLDEGSYPVIDQGDRFIAGYTNDESIVQFEPLPLLVFGDHTRRLKFVDYPFASGADGTQLLYPKNKNLLPIYFYIAVKNIDLSNFHYARHFKFLKQEYILIPADKMLLKFNNLTNPFYEEIQLLKDKNQLLQQTRDLLLPRLISGKLSVEHLVEGGESLMMAAEPEGIYQAKK